MTNHSKTSAKIEENLYQILDVPNTANLAEIRQAYEGKLEETHLEAFAAYSLLPEEETEEKLLQFSHAYITLANPIARAKYDDELNQLTIPAETKSDSRKGRAKTANESSRKSAEKIQSEEKAKLSKKVANDVAGQTLKERQDFYLNLAAKNEHTEDNIQEFYDCLLYTSPSPRDGLLSRMPSSA